MLRDRKTNHTHERLTRQSLHVDCLPQGDASSNRLKSNPNELPWISDAVWCIEKTQECSKNTALESKARISRTDPAFTWKMCEVVWSVERPASAFKSHAQESKQDEEIGIRVHLHIVKCVEDKAFLFTLRVHVFHSSDVFLLSPFAVSLRSPSHTCCP